MHRSGEGFYPETGQELEITPNLVNVPLDPGVKGKEYLSKFEQYVYPAIDQFAPSLLLLSAGFDAHKKDHLAKEGGLMLDTSTYVSMTRRLCSLADKHCEGRLVSLLEGASPAYLVMVSGGYNTVALGDCVMEHVRTLAAHKQQPAASAAPLASPLRRAEPLQPVPPSVTGVASLGAQLPAPGQPELFVEPAAKRQRTVQADPDGSSQITLSFSSSLLRKEPSHASSMINSLLAQQQAPEEQHEGVEDAPKQAGAEADDPVAWEISAAEEARMQSLMDDVVRVGTSSDHNYRIAYAHLTKLKQDLLATNSSSAKRPAPEPDSPVLGTCSEPIVIESQESLQDPADVPMATEQSDVPRIL
eukprot:TRINITY_DN16965_c0_g1_i4.p1 TRINITY_DN16965_c0_g1~~TRINITY_DN16965_c0_g1_i4.p1  ORF type:complete len:359 (+),score=54.61 TRINITY_DN16965_c0_g1_i4:160-1236(+)